MTAKNVLYALAVVVLTVSMPDVLHCEEAKVGSSQPATVGSSQPATVGSSQPATVGSSEPATVGSGAAGSGQPPRPYGFQGPGGGGSNPPTGETGGK
jgi:hypothetical protein